MKSNLTCDVMKQRWVPLSRHGWLCPLLPNFILKLGASSAKLSNWCPRQIPNSGKAGLRFKNSAKYASYVTLLRRLKKKKKHGVELTQF